MGEAAVCFDSDDEAPPERTSQRNDEERSADYLDALTTSKKKHIKSATDGIIFSRQESTASKKKRYHYAIKFEDVLGHIVGCNDKNKRASVVVGSKRLHVLCDNRLTQAEYTPTARQAVILGQELCNICKARKHRWRFFEANKLSATQGNVQQSKSPIPGMGN